MRLSDTLTRKITELPEPPADIGIYVCGPTVYQRIHIGNARPFVIFSWLRDYLRSRGYSVAHVSNITDVNDKIYEAAPGASAARARDATQWYLDDTRSFGLEMPDEQPGQHRKPEGEEPFQRRRGDPVALDRGQDDRRVQQPRERSGEAPADRAAPERDPHRRHEVEVAENRIRALPREGHDRGQQRHQRERQRGHGARVR